MLTFIFVNVFSKCKLYSNIKESMYLLSKSDICFLSTDFLMYHFAKIINGNEGLVQGKKLR